MGPHLARKPLGSLVRGAWYRSAAVRSASARAPRSTRLAGMRAATIVDNGLAVRDHPDPRPEAGEVLVAVRAAGLNAADLLQVKGFYPAPPGSPPDIPGMEFAGEVVALGPSASRFSIGDRVMALVGGGAQAELAVVHERAAHTRPRQPRLDRRRGIPRGVHHRPRRPGQPGAHAHGRAGAHPWRRRGRRGGRGAVGAPGGRQRHRHASAPSHSGRTWRRWARTRSSRLRGSSTMARSTSSSSWSALPTSPATSTRWRSADGSWSSASGPERAPRSTCAP